MLRAFWTLPPTLSHLLFLLFRATFFFYCLEEEGAGILLWRCSLLLPGMCWDSSGVSFEPVNTTPEMGRGAGYQVSWGTPVCPGAEIPLGKHSLLITKERRQNKHEKGLHYSFSTFHSYLSFSSICNFLPSFFFDFPPCFRISVFVNHVLSLCWDVFQRSIYFFSTIENKKVFF